LEDEVLVLDFEEGLGFELSLVHFVFDFAEEFGEFIFVDDDH
jgi:hypothetical protein